MKSSTTAVAAIAPNNAGSLSSLVTHSTTPTNTTGNAIGNMTPEMNMTVTATAIQATTGMTMMIGPQEQNANNGDKSPGFDKNHSFSKASGIIQGIAEKLHTLGAAGNHNCKSDTDSGKL